MKIAISATHGSLDAQIDLRFGRCPCFLIVETDDLSFEVIENPNVSLGGGAGIQSAQLVANQGVKNVLTGNCGPNAYKALSAAGIEIISGCSGPVREAITRFLDGDYSPSAKENAPSHFGASGFPQDPEFAGNPEAVYPMNTGGRGMGGGSGRGMGGGGGRGMGMGGYIQSQPVTGPTSTPANELDALKQQANSLSQQLQHIQRQIGLLQNGKQTVAAIDKKLCTGCGACLKVCPSHAIHMEGQTALVDEKLCIGCGACAPVCPVEAIQLV